MNNLLEKNAKVIHDKSLNSLYVHLSGFISYDELVKVLQYEFQMISYFKLQKCIVNLAEIKVYPSGGREYIKEVWFPQVEALGLKHVAFVVPENVFGDASMQKAHEKAEAHKLMKTKHFKDEASAKKWIEETACEAVPML